jgi:Flp pilus assembly protein TadG
MNTLAQLSGLQRRIARFATDRSGVSAVEFAMLLPLMITLYLGTVEISQGVAIDRKVTLTSRTIADLTSQVSTIATSDMTNVFDAASSVIAPYNTDMSLLTMTVSLVTIDASSAATVTWSCTRNGTKHAVNSSVTLPSALNIANTTLVWSEASYTYRPAIGYVVTGTLNLSDQIYMRPRLSDTITGPPSC